ncbi:hypothetical protein GCM10009720_19080 [Yaniella flava]|uniref:Uncharacterized protein n=1 Tax=Yaniella flava TaxID=287930 RepID=A0ABN2ULQ4_9MICC|nr:hypothetical protein [Micrococcaceae bacterium]
MFTVGYLKPNDSAVAGARSELADKIYTPWWYHPTLGVLVGLTALLLGKTFGTVGIFLGTLPVLGMVGLAFTYRRLSGVDLIGEYAVTGRAKGRRLLRLLAIVVGIILITSPVLGSLLGLNWAPWILAIIAVVLISILGRAYDRTLRAELREPMP